LHVAGFVHDTHAACPELLQNFEMAQDAAGHFGSYDITESSCLIDLGCKASSGPGNTRSPTRRFGLLRLGLGCWAGSVSGFGGEFLPGLNGAPDPDFPRFFLQFGMIALLPRPIAPRAALKSIESVPGRGGSPEKYVWNRDSASIMTAYRVML
jgi:hypothetical protein